MESVKTYKCPKCQAINHVGTHTCSSCNETTVIAIIKSQGTGNVPKDYLWPIFPYDVEIGSSSANEIVIPSNRVAKKHCKLVYQQGAMFLERTDKQNPVYMNNHNLQMGIKQKLNEGAVIRIGLDEIKIHYHNLKQADFNLKTEKEKGQMTKDMKHAVNPIASRLMLMLGYLQELHSSMDVKDLLSSSVDAVLKLTNLDRGYAFITEVDDDGDLSLNKVISRKVGGLDFFEKDYTISRSMLEKVTSGDGSVIIEDADETQSTNSIRDFKIKSIVCLPLKSKNPETGEINLLGVIYADKMMAKTNLPKQIKTSLQVLTQLIVANIHRCQKYREALDTCKQYNSYIKNLGEEVYTVSENLGVITDNMFNTKELSQFKNLAQYIDGEQEKF